MHTAILKKSTVAVLKCFLVLAAATGQTIAATNILTEDFEDGVLDGRLTISTIGTFGIQPGIQSITSLGSTKAFGYGASTCGASCFNSFVTRLLITFSSPTYVSTIQFKEMELYENWGSNGVISVDGLSLTGQTSDFGRLPYNDRVADSTFRTHTFAVNNFVSVINLGVYDITSRSQIALDDLVITSVPELPIAPLLILGLTALAYKHTTRGAARRDA